MSEPLSSEAYAAAGGVVCPVCSRTEVEMAWDLTESDCRTVFQAADCLVCGASWRTIYTLTGYDSLDDGEPAP